MSSLTIMCPTLPLLMFLILCSSSYVTIMLLVIRRFGTKVFWDSETTLGKIYFKQFTVTLEIIRETTLLKLIGLQSAKCVESFFGIRTMCVWFIFFSIWPECKTNKIASMISWPTICHYFWKKKGDIPTDPSAFDECIWKRALRTSSGLYHWVSLSVICGVTRLSTACTTPSILTVGLLQTGPWNKIRPPWLYHPPYCTTDPLHRIHHGYGFRVGFGWPDYGNTSCSCLQQVAKLIETVVRIAHPGESGC